MIKFKYLHIYLTAVFLSAHALYCQKAVDPSKTKKYDVILNNEDQTVKAQVLRKKKTLCVKADKIYHWYSSQKILETAGGYDGKLLHGNYAAFYLNDQLKEKGCFVYGLKHHLWMYWYPNGKLREVITWKKGRKHGYYALYNDFGELMAEGHFKNDKLCGTFTTYGTGKGVLEKKKYKKGRELPPTPPKAPKEEIPKPAATS